MCLVLVCSRWQGLYHSETHRIPHWRYRPGAKGQSTTETLQQTEEVGSAHVITHSVGPSKRISGTPMFEISHRPCKRVSLRETAMGLVSQPNM